MDQFRSRLNPQQPQLDAVEKSISDLDSLVQALLSSLAAAKPWQRQLRAHLEAADRMIEVLRLTIRLNRSQAERVQAAGTLLTSLRAANNYIGPSRSDMGTKLNVQLGLTLAQRVVVAVNATRAT